jgi:hypothetical protein
MLKKAEMLMSLDASCFAAALHGAEHQNAAGAGLSLIPGIGSQPSSVHCHVRQFHLYKFKKAR